MMTHCLTSTARSSTPGRGLLRLQLKQKSRGAAPTTIRTSTSFHPTGEQSLRMETRSRASAAVLYGSRNAHTQ